MNPEIDARMPQIEELCRRYGIVRLELFGSATGPDFDPVKSDFDFLAEFADRGPNTRFAKRFFEFEQDLASLFSRKVDLHTSHFPIKNPFLARSIDESRRTIYGPIRERSSA